VDQVIYDVVFTTYSGRFSLRSPACVSTGLPPRRRGPCSSSGRWAASSARSSRRSPCTTRTTPLAYAADHSGAVATGALLVLVMGLSLALIPVVLFPVLRRVDEVLATGYLIIRGAVEAATYVMIAIAWLQLVPLADTMSAGPGTASSPAGVRLGALVIDSDGASVVMSLVFCLGAALFYVLLFRSRIVPRWIASWGLMGIPFCAAAYLLVRYGAVGIDSSQGNLLCLPL